jgi:membrane protein DedA with SNARE-associated domain
MEHIFSLREWLGEHRLAWLFILTFFIGGTTVTSLAGFLVKIGWFDFSTVVLFAATGSLTRNIVYYYLGKSSKNFVGKYGHHIGITLERMEKIASWYAKYPIRTFFIVKNSPCMAAPGLAAAGLIGFPMSRYLFWVAVNTIFNVFMFAGTGYFAGEAYAKAAKLEGLMFAFLSVLIVFFAWSYQRYFKKAGKQVMA